MTFQSVGETVADYVSIRKEWTHIGWQLAALPVTASSCPLGTGKKTQCTGREVRLPNRCAVLLCGFSYRTCAMRLPMAWAASSCFWRVVWVYVRGVKPAS
jgi:hypothetical protein